MTLMSEEQAVRIGYTKHSFMRTGLHGKWEPQVSRSTKQCSVPAASTATQSCQGKQKLPTYSMCSKQPPIKNTRYKSILTRLLRT